MQISPATPLDLPQVPPAWTAPLDPSLPRPQDRLDLSSLASSLAKDHKAMAMMEFHYQAVHAVSTSLSDGKLTRTEFMAQSFEMDLTVVGDPEAARELFQKLKEEWSPDKVADRIAAFATKGFGRQGLPQDRAGFRGLVQKAVESGYSQARSLLGPVGEEVASSLEETMKRVRDLLDIWAKGPEAEPEAGAPL